MVGNNMAIIAEYYIYYIYISIYFASKWA